MSADGVAAARPENLRAGGGSSPTSALQRLWVTIITLTVAKKIIDLNHYTHSTPGATKLCFGMFDGASLKGAMILGAGPALAYRLVNGAKPNDCLTLTRLWLSDDLGFNSESRFIGIVLRMLKKHTEVKFLVSYADPVQGHVGFIYQATNWLFTGISSAMPLYDIGDGRLQHSRSLSHSYGSHSVAHFKNHGIDVKVIPQMGKYRYLYLLDPNLKSRLSVPILPYPKMEDTDGND